MAQPTMKYAIAVINKGGEWLYFHETNNAEMAMQLAASELERCQLRAYRPQVYSRAIGVDIMERNNNGDYDGLASFKRS